MNQRGSIEWSLVNIGKLLIGVAFLLLIFFFAIALMGIFKNEDSVQAKKNFDMLITRINTVHDDKLQGAGASLLFSIPNNYALIGFDAGNDGKTTSLTYTIGNFNAPPIKTLSRPNSCKDTTACICMMKYDISSTDSQSQSKLDSMFIPTACANVPYKKLYSMETNIYFTSNIYGSNDRTIQTSFGNTIHPLFLTGYVFAGQTAYVVSVAPIRLDSQNENELFLRYQKPGLQDTSSQGNGGITNGNSGNTNSQGSTTTEICKNEVDACKSLGITCCLGKPSQTFLMITASQAKIYKGFDKWFFCQKENNACVLHQISGPCKKVYKDGKEVSDSKCIGKQPLCKISTSFLGQADDRATYDVCNYRDSQQTTIFNGICIQTPYIDYLGSAADC